MVPPGPVGAPGPGSSGGRDETLQRTFKAGPRHDPPGVPVRVLVPALLVSVLALSSAGWASGGEVTVNYIAGSHTLMGVARNVPVVGELPISTAFAVCQQDVRHPLLPGVRFTSPGVGGACAIPLPAHRFSISVKDGLLGALAYEYQPVDEAGEPCAPLGQGSSGHVFQVPPDCAYVTVWPAATATYGTITVRAA
jgi:hypothetical protein